jgi:hypothetical protein
MTVAHVNHVERAGVHGLRHMGELEHARALVGLGAMAS